MKLFMFFHIPLKLAVQVSQVHLKSHRFVRLVARVLPYSFDLPYAACSQSLDLDLVVSNQELISASIRSPFQSSFAANAPHRLLFLGRIGL